MSKIVDFEKVRLRHEGKELDEETLISETRDALNDLREMGKVPKAALLMVFDGEDDTYVVVYNCAKVLPATIVGALEVAKMRLILQEEQG